MVYKALVLRPDVSFSFWFRNPFVDPRQAKCTVEPPSLQNKFKLQQSDISDNHFEITWCVYTTLTRDEAPPLDVPTDLRTFFSSIQMDINSFSPWSMSSADATWAKEQLKAPRSVTIAVSNNTAVTFYRKKIELTRGSWTCLPPDALSPGKTLRFGSKGATMTGTTGRVVYQSEASSEPVELFFDNPFIGDIQVVCSRPKGFLFEVSFRKQEHLRLSVEIFPSPDKLTTSPGIAPEDQLLSSSSSSALPLHKVNPRPTSAGPDLSPSVGNSTNSRGSKRDLPHTQLVSGEEDEDEPRRSLLSSERSQTSLDHEQTDDIAGAPSKRTQPVEKVPPSSTHRISIDLGTRAMWLKQLISVLITIALLHSSPSS